MIPFLQNRDFLQNGMVVDFITDYSVWFQKYQFALTVLISFSFNTELYEMNENLLPLSKNISLLDFGKSQ